MYKPRSDAQQVLIPAFSDERRHSVRSSRSFRRAALWHYAHHAAVGLFGLRQPRRWFSILAIASVLAAMLAVAAATVWERMPWAAAVAAPLPAVWERMPWTVAAERLLL